ncbi:MAG: hypothetical protein JWN73_1888 [Betaproteobacteria bacterium]|nr:hypothetical protein [Betaproteobacteria bacterium]
MWWPNRIRRRTFERPLVETLESRILYSADLAAAALPPVAVPPAETRALDANGDFAAATAAPVTTLAGTPATTASGRPLAFELNVGQASPDFDALARGSGFTVGLSKGNATLVLGNGEAQRTVSLNLDGASAAAQLTPDGQLQARSNYLVGNDPALWHTDVVNYDGVTYKSVYNGIDLKYYGSGQQLEYDFTVNPGAHAQDIAMHFDGAQSVALDADGNLLIQLDASGSSIRFLAPVAYQDGPSGRQSVTSQYTVAADGSVHFSVGAYDQTRALIIDPILSYGSYLGTTAAESANAVAVDAAGNVYVAGYSNSTFFGTGGEDVTVQKLSSDLSTVLYSTTYGGSGNEEANAIAVDGAGAVYVTGWTQSAGLIPFPTTAGAYQNTRSGPQDAFLFKLNAAGSGLVYSSYLGGSGNGDVGNGVAVDSSGDAYVTGTTNSPNFPVTAGAADTTYAAGEAFVTKFNAAGTGLVYSTFIGGSGADSGNAIAITGSGQAVVVGTTASSNLATVNAFQSTRDGGTDAFVARLNVAGSAFDYSTYFGGANNDTGAAVALRTDGAIVFGGSSQSRDLTTTANAFQASTASGSADTSYLAILDPGSGTLDYATYIAGSRGNNGNGNGNGGAGAIDLTGIAVDATGRIYAVGSTVDSNFSITANALDGSYGGNTDSFVMLIDPALSGSNGLVYSSYLGGSGSDVATGAAYRAGALYVVGSTTSNSAIAVAGGADTTYNGGMDGFVVGFAGIAGVNHAPVLSGANSAATVLEDATGNAGTLVSALISGHLSDGDSGAIAGIAVTAVDNTNGTWQYSTNNGTTWSAFGAPSGTSARLLAADANTRVRFVPNANFNGTVTNGITFRGWDQTSGTTAATASTAANGGATAFSAATATSGITVTQVNDAPAGTSRTVTTLEDTSYTFSAADFGFSDPNDTPANLLANIRIGSLSGAGSLTLSGAAVAAGQFISAASIAAGNLKFTPAANANGAGYASFTFQVQDNGGTANGGVDLDPVARTLTVNVTSVNDAPVLSGANDLAAITEDAGSNAGTAVTTLIAGKLSDFDAGALSGIAVTSVDNTNGAWQYSTNNGTTWAAFGAPSGTSARLLAADANTRVRFVPNANWTGAVANGLTFRAWDQTSGVAGGTANTSPNGGATAFSGATASSGITVSSVNDAPVGASHTVTTAEDTPYTFSVADFGFTDPNDAPANALANVKISTLPSAGTLTLSGVAVTAGQFISAGAITAGNLKFSAATNANGVGYAGFTFQVQDDGGTAGGGIDLDATPRTMTVNVSPVNDPPQLGLPSAQSTASNTAKVFSTAGGNAISVADVDAGGGALSLTLTVANGTLTLSGTAGLAFSVGSGSADTTMTFSGTLVALNVALDGMRYDPNPGYSGSTTLSAQVNDLGNSGSGGARADSGNVVINVSFVNSAPVISGSNNLQTILEDAATNAGTAVSALINGHVTDIDTGAVNGIAVTAVDNTNGNWQYSIDGGGNWSSFGSPGAGSARLLAADAGTLVRFVPNANWNGTVTNGISFRAWDQTAGAAGATADTSVNGGTTAFSSALAGAAVTVTPVNDAPAGADRVVTTLEETPYTFSSSDFGFTDPADASPNNLLSVRISSLPANGSLTDNGVAVGVGQFISSADIGAGKLVYTAPVDASGTAYTAFTFQVRDDGGAASGGIDLDPVAHTVTVNITPVNDAPAGTSNTVAINEDTPYALSVADFGFSDSNDSPANALLNVRISSLPTVGQLTLNGAAVSAGQFVSVANISAGKLVYAPSANANGPAYASFAFQVQDDGGTANGGVDLDPVARVMSFDVSPVNDAPSGTSGSINALEDAGYVFNIADFGFTDAVDSPQNQLLNVKVAALPGAGALTLNGAAVAAGQFVSAADIAAGKLIFTPGAGNSGASYAAFTFQVQDDGGTVAGGNDLDPSAKTLAINVAPVNDAPVGAAGTVNTLEDTPYTFTLTDFAFSDPSDTPANALLGVKISALPSAGQLLLNGVAVSAGQIVQASAIAAGKLIFVPGADGNGSAYASLSYQAQDDGGTANGGIDLDPVARPITIQVASVNDPPVSQDNTIGIATAQVYTFVAADFGFSDASDTPANALAGVRINSLPAAGVLALNGIAVTANQAISAAAINSGELTFISGSPATASFSFGVRDTGGTANGGVSVEIGSHVMTLAVSDPVAAAPVTAPPPPALSTTTTTTTTRTQTVTSTSNSASSGNAAAVVPPPAPAPALPPPPALSAGGFLQAVDFVIGTEGSGASSQVRPVEVLSAERRFSREVATAPAETPLLTFGLRAADNNSATDPLSRSMRAKGFIDELDQLRDDARSEFNLDRIFALSSSGVTFGLSLGLMIWIVRSGVLMSSLLSVMPAWRVLDPLPVLANAGGNDENEDETDDSEFSAAASSEDPLRILRES